MNKEDIMMSGKILGIIATHIKLFEDFLHIKLIDITIENNLTTLIFEDEDFEITKYNIVFQKQY